MAITPSVLFSGVCAPSGTTFATTSISPAANALLLAVSAPRFNADPVPPVIGVTGNGLTWDRIGERGFGPRMLSCHRSMGASPSAGAVTFTESDASSFFANSIACMILQFTGVVTSGTNGSGAIDLAGYDDSYANFTTSIALNLAGATPAAGDVTFGCMGTEDDATSVAGDALWANISTAGGPGISECILLSDYDDGQDNSPTWTWGGNQEACAIGFLIKAAAAAAGSPYYYYQQQLQQ
jgi:hypothetical protein